MTSTVSPGRGALCIATRALRAWLLSAFPPDKSHSPIEAPHNYLSAYGLKPWAESYSPSSRGNRAALKNLSFLCRARRS
jgi:hypothetical protein